MRRTVPLLCIVALLASVRLSAQERDSVARPTSHVARRLRATWDVERGTGEVGRATDDVGHATWNVGRATVHWGKWLTAGAAAALTVMGAHEHESSNREFRRLLDLCRADNADCDLGPDGAYLNPAAEQLYQGSIYFDRRARTRLLAGQASLLLAAGLFIADLRRRTGGPGNKPLAPLQVAGDVRAGGVQVGVRWTF